MTTGGGPSLRLIGVHAKSKAPHGARDAEGMHPHVDREPPQATGAMPLAARSGSTAHLAAGDSLIVMGDFNDGPGLDEFEKLFGHSGVEIVLGLDWPRRLQLYRSACRNGAEPTRRRCTPTTARF